LNIKLRPEKYKNKKKLSQSYSDLTISLPAAVLILQTCFAGYLVGLKYSSIGNFAKPKIIIILML
jgi:hypothetical protein